MELIMYTIIDSLDDLNLDTTKPVFFDTETNGLYGRIELAQFMQEGWNAAKLIRRPSAVMLAAFLEDKHCVIHNAHYDITTLQLQLGALKWIPKKFDCTLYLSRLRFYTELTHSLNNVLEYALGYDPYSDSGIDKKEMQKSNWSTLTLTDEQLTYAAIDVFYMPELWRMIEPNTEDFVYKLDILALRSALDFQRNGFPVETDKLINKVKETQATLLEVDSPDVNCNSWKQVRAYLGGINESDEIALLKIGLNKSNDNAQKALNIIKSRKMIKRLNFLQRFDVDDGLIYGLFAPSARSGRFTCKGKADASIEIIQDNLQQIPRALKGMFGVTHEDNQVLIYSDFSQLELRCIAAITGCSVMVKLMKEGIDIHSFVAERLFGSNFTKEHRRITKTFNFGMLYGIGLKGLGDMLIKQANAIYTEQELAQHRRTWKKTFPGVAAWQERGISKWRAGETGITPLGRRYKAKLMTDFLSVENQGFGAEVAKLAMHKMTPMFNEVTRLRNFIHDSYLITTINSPELYKPACESVANAMQQAWFDCTKGLRINDIPMPVDVYVGKNWGDIEDDDIENIYEYKLTGMENYE